MCFYDKLAWMEYVGHNFRFLKSDIDVVTAVQTLKAKMQTSLRHASFNSATDKRP